MPGLLEVRSEINWVIGQPLEEVEAVKLSGYEECPANRFGVRKRLTATF